MPTLYESLLPYRGRGLTALRFGRRSFTYDEMLHRVDRVAAYLSSHGIKQGDVVTVSLPNIPQAVFLFYALDKLGARQNLLHPQTTPENLLSSMESVGSRTAVLLATAYGEKASLFRGDKQFFFVNPLGESRDPRRRLFYLQYKKPRGENLYLLDDYRRCPADTEPPRGEADEGSILLHSGGTTGTPKVISLSSSALAALAAKVPAIIGGSIEGGGMLAVLPTFHGFGLGMGIHAPLQNGATAVLMMKFNADRAIRHIERKEVSLMIGVPLLYRKLMAAERFKTADLSSLTHAFVGGDNVPPSLLAAFDDEMKKRGVDCRLLEGYGLTETVTVCTVNTKSAVKPHSVGRPLPGLSVRICLADLTPADVGEVGEVLVGGDTLMCGYLHDEAETQRTLVTLNDVPYIRSGDLGYLDPDGFLFLKGRKKRMFKISGMNVYPAEVERLATDNPYIADASLEFYEEPSPHTVLFLIKQREAAPTEEQLIADLYRLLGEKLLKYALPQRIVFLPAFPKTEIGKIRHGDFSHP